MTHHSALVSDRRDGSEPILATVEQRLDDLSALLRTTPVDVYVATPVPNVSGSIGEHVRHLLDHVTAFIGAEHSATLCYDHRERGTAVETDPDAALDLLLRLKASLAVRAADLLDRPVEVESLIGESGECLTSRSTMARELAFVVGHTVHHQAMIAILLSVQGRRVPDRFGFAPSTPRTLVGS